MTDQPDRLSAALANRYAIERELGRVGMATVYLGRDLRRHRPVAVKTVALTVRRPWFGPTILRASETRCS